jgi:hypothetical protein
MTGPTRRRALLGSVVAVLVLATGCSAEPEASADYQRLEQQYLEAQAKVAALEQALAASAGVEFTALPENVVKVYGEYGGCVPNVHEEEHPDGIRVYSGGFSCPGVRSSDPRLDGDVELTLVGAGYADYLPNSGIPETGRFEISVVLTTNDGERWSGDGFGVDLYDGEGTIHTVYYTELAGEGKYDGLIYREWGMQQPRVYGDSPTTLYDGYFASGWIEQLPSDS